MSSRRTLRQAVTDLPIPRKLSLILGLFSIVVFILLALSYSGMEILSGSRAYVGGEGLWSKAQKSAVHRLTRYAFFHDEADYQKYLKAMAISIGDHQARLELAKPRMNFGAVIRGFVQGRNHPDDIGIMAFMARNFYKFPYMGKALDLWGQADRHIEKLHNAAQMLHHEITSPSPSPQRVKVLLEEIQQIDEQLTPLEDDFSYTLGEGARWLKAVLLAIMVVTTGVFLTLTLLIAVLISRRLCQEIDQLRAGAARIAGGDYSLSLDTGSKDEIGDLARSFQQMAVQRERAERIKDEFFANVSHELRTPLTLILSPLESLLSGDSGAIEERAKPHLQTMHNNAVRLLQLVNGLLDFSKLEAGKIQAHREPLRIADLTDMVFNDFRPLIQERGLIARLESNPAKALVLMDHYLYERILFNLLSNAVKFTGPGGQVTVRMIWAEDQLWLSVSDSGIGIPPGELDNIFQRFRQVEGSSTRRFEGTGLGLALVKEFAALLEGNVSVKSVQGKGSTFTMICPAPAAPASLPAPADLARAPHTLHLAHVSPLFPASVTTGDPLPKVLVAEDNSEMAAYIATLLEPFCQVRTARDGNEALEILRSWPAELILSDVMMPGRDGLSLCREVKSDAATASIPVVMLTALTHREALLEGWKAGADEYLFKPFHPKELITRIQSLLKSRRDKRQADEKIMHLNETLRHQALDLTAANQELEAFSYSVSHDLRAPLRAIDGFSLELLRHCQSLLDERSKEDLQRIRAASQRMAQLIDSLLELSHLSRSELKRVDVDLSALVHEIAQDLSLSAPERPIEWVIAPHLTAEADPALLRVALQNLIQNAWKFTERQARPKIEFGALEREGRRLFFLADNGVGFNMAYAGKLFKPFQRLHDVKDFPGTGIGLALVHRIILRHGGEIWTESQENHGAVFYFSLRQAVRSGAPLSTAQPSAAPSPTGIF